MKEDLYKNDKRPIKNIPQLEMAENVILEGK